MWCRILLSWLFLFVLILSLNKSWELLEKQLSGFTTCMPGVTWGQGHFAPRVM